MHTEHVLRGLGSNPALPAELLRPLLECKVPGRVAAHLRENLPDWLAEEFAASEHEEVLLWLAGTPNLPAEVHRALAAHPEAAVRWRLTRVADELPPDVLDAGDRPRLAGTAVPRQVRTGRPLARLAEDPDPRIRELAPRDPELPDGLLEELATDPEARVRRAVAGHPRLPLTYLLALLADDDARTAEAAGGNPSLPVSEMARIIAAAGLGKSVE
ncbi:hypothetical protein AB0C77_02485 [Streptomyces sp. NPDC048629]|uniref:hypothetical protein n=1 Tax=Streptomyces sp. NPDC048629 TaxID=3154824 RepID=UPI0034428FA7